MILCSTSVLILWRGVLVPCAQKVGVWCYESPWPLLAPVVGIDQRESDVGHSLAFHCFHGQQPRLRGPPTSPASGYWTQQPPSCNQSCMQIGWMHLRLDTITFCLHSYPDFSIWTICTLNSTKCAWPCHNYTHVGLGLVKGCGRWALLLSHALIKRAGKIVNIVQHNNKKNTCICTSVCYMVQVCGSIHNILKLLVLNKRSSTSSLLVHTYVDVMLAL